MEDSGADPLFDYWENHGLACDSGQLNIFTHKIKIKHLHLQKSQ